MSYTNTYIVSTQRDFNTRTAIVSSGNSKGALLKFLFHTHPEEYDDKSIQITSRSMEGHKELICYEVTDKSGSFVVSVRKINIREDFILI